MTSTSTAVVRELLERQRAWAAAREIELVDGEHVARLDDHLFGPLSSEARAELGAALAAEGKPPEPHSLLSRTALACNLLDPLRAAFPGRAFAAPGCERVQLAAPLSGEDPACEARADAVLAGDGARPAALVLRYREPYESADNRLSAQELESPWGPLAMCRALAQDLRVEPRRFRSLPAADLLRLARGWAASTGPRGYRMLYIWHDVGTAASAAHRREIDRFRMRVGGEVAFEARTLRAVVEALEADGAGSAHAAWLRERYLGG